MERFVNPMTHMYFFTHNLYPLGTDLFDNYVYASRRHIQANKWTQAIYFQLLNWALANAFIVFRLALTEWERTHTSFGRFKLDIYEQLIQRAKIQPVSLALPRRKENCHLPEHE